MSWVAVHAVHWWLPLPEIVSAQQRFGLCAPSVRAAWDTLVRDGGDARSEWLMQVVAPVLGHAWIHNGVVGAAFNAAFFWLFGSRIEARVGALRFVVLVLCIVIGGAVAHLVLRPEEPKIVVGGAVLTAAMLVAYLALYPRARVSVLVPLVVLPLFFVVPALLLAPTWVAAQFRPLQELLLRGPARPWSYELLGIGAMFGVVAVFWIAKRCPAAKERRAAWRASASRR